MFYDHWNRKKVVEFLEKEVFPQVEFNQWLNVPGELADIIKMVREYRMTSNYPKEMNADVKNGFLFINGDPVGRIALRKGAGRSANYSDKAYYYEGRILARQEAE